MYLHELAIVASPRMSDQCDPFPLNVQTYFSISSTRLES